MKKPSKNDLKLIFLWIFAFLVIIFIMTQTVNASEPEEPSYPLYIDSEMNPTDRSLEEIKTAFSAMWGDLPSNYVIYCSSIDQSYFNGPNGWDYYDVYNYVIGTEPIFEYPITLDVNSSYYYITNTVEYRLKYFTHSDHWGGYDSYSNLRHQMAYYYIAQGFGYILEGTEEEYTSTDNIVVWAHRHNDPVINTGVAVVPPPFIVPEYLTGDTPPTTVPPSYTINNYTWTTAPTFDGSSVINGIQSIKDTLEWLADNLKNSISNLLNNLKGLAEYIGKTIQYYGNAIIQTINNAIQNFYDNMVALIEPIVSDLNELKQNFLDFADLFIHPFDEEEFQEQMESCELINQYNELMDNADDIRAIFNNAEERDYFVLYIDFENPFADSEHKIIHSEISFTWLKDYRSTYRPFLWLFTMIECFVGGMRLLGGIIGGKAK